MKELIAFRKYLNEGVINEGVNLEKKYNNQEELNAGVDEIANIIDDLISNVEHVENSPFNGSSLINNGLYFIDEYDDYLEDEEPIDGFDIISSACEEGLDIRLHYARPGAGLGNDDMESKPDESEWKDEYPDLTYEEWWDMMNGVGDEAWGEVNKFLKSKGKEGL